jgi:hypothetical protein
MYVSECIRSLRHDARQGATTIASGATTSQHLPTYHNGFTNFFVLNSGLDTLEVIVETTLKSNHELDSSSVTGVDGLDSLGQVSSDRLLAENVFSVGSSSLDLFGMELGWGANPDGINIRVSNDIHGIVGELGDVELLGG